MAAQRAPIRRWLSAAYVAMSAVELGVHYTAIRCAMELRVGIGSVHLTVELLALSARRRHGQRKRGISEVVVLRQLYRQWLASDSN